jgi:predicted GNAT family acetyltransferase
LATTTLQDVVSTQVTDNPDEERYEVTEDGTLAGFVQYRSRPGLLALIHTEIDPRFEGRGLGSTLAQGVLDDAAARHLQVLPFCPFVNAYIARHPEYVSLVPADHREQFGL